MAIAKRLEETTEDIGEEGGDSLFAEINITPLTDVFLVMVVIFMVSALAVQAEQNLQKKEKEKAEQIDKSRGLKINLPQGESQEIDPSKASLVLEVPLAGNVVVGGKEFTDEKIDDLFRAAFTKDKSTQVILKADKGVQHGRVVNLMERAKKSGLTRLAIGTGK